MKTCEYGLSYIAHVYNGEGGGTKYLLFVKTSGTEITGRKPDGSESQIIGSGRWVTF